MTDDEFIKEMIEVMMAAPNPGDRVAVNGRPGTFVDYAPSAATCQITYIVDHDDGERVSWWCGDFDPNRPKIEVIARA